MKLFDIFLLCSTLVLLFLITLTSKNDLASLTINKKASIDQTNYQPIKSANIPILLYHYVEFVKDPGDTIRKSLDVNPNIFDLQVKTLVNAGFTFITPSEIPDILSGKTKLPKKPIILSFDDGYKDFYTDVFPILKKYNVKAVAYVVPGFINKPNNLSSKQLSEIANSSLVEIGGHTMDHADLKGLPKNRVIFEVLQGKQILESMIKQSVVSFAYPYGLFDSQASKIVKDSGYETAVTTTAGVAISINDSYQVPRVRVGSRTGQNLLNYLNYITNNHY